MKYTQTKFTLPAASPATKQKDWDRAFMSEAEFKEKYKEEEGTDGVQRQGCLGLY